MSLSGIDTSKLINQFADSDIVKDMLLNSSLSWDRLPIGEDNGAYFATLSENYPGPNISRETVFAKKLNPKFPDIHEACDFFVIEINFWKYDDDKITSKFEIAHGIKADFTAQQTIQLLGKPTNNDGIYESCHWEFPKYDLNISFEERISHGMLSSNTPETLEIIKLTQSSASNTKENPQHIKPEEHKNTVDTSKLSETGLETISEPDNKSTIKIIIGVAIVILGISLLLN